MNLTKLSWVLVCCLLLCATAHPGPPNLVLIITDDQGYPDLSCNGNPHLKTPNIDRLKQEGASLERFYVSPVCSPTRASLMTGRYNYRTGVVDTYIGRSLMHASEVTLAERLRAAGYHTGIFGKWHLGDTYPLRAMDQGFEEALVCRGGGVGQPSDPPGNSYFNPRLQHNGEEVATEGYCTDVFTRAGIEYIREHKNDPFFVYLPYNAPHSPLTVDERYVQPFIEQGLDEDTARVYGMVANIDENVGKVLDTLHELALDERTLVLFMTDNGAAYGAKHARYTAGMRGTKGTTYEGGIRVPCYLRWPGTIAPGVVRNEVLGHIDLHPTLLEGLGVAPDASAALDGRSFWPLVTGKSNEWPARSLVLQWHRGDEPRPFENSAVVEQRFKLVNGTELYDLQADPSESTDISAGAPDEVARMRGVYEGWFADVSATRGYAPPRILLAPAEAPLTVLTPQDWRGTQDFGRSNHAYWEVATDEAGPYTIAFDLQEPVDSGRVKVEIAGQRVWIEVPKGATTVQIEGVELPAHLEDRLTFTVEHESKGGAVAYARVWRSDRPNPNRN